MANIEIRFTKGGNSQKAWNPEDQKQNLTDRRTTYTSRISRAEEKILALDRFDDFSQLNIDARYYEKGPSGVYGIQRDPKKHGGGAVIRSKQQRAAEQMLRDLRGFGLLADVVGSGKTYEAGVVLSELAERDRISNMLIVTPSQVFNDWVDVIETKFGLGKGQLVQVRDGDPANTDFYSVLNKIYTRNSADKIIHPAKSVIVDVKVFAQWKIPDNIVFDVIVVDEAHHLCKEEGEYAKAMKLLSQLMSIKKATGSQTYCLLLSATPHSGNLENMFRLWYFVRCQGGNPDDFAEQEDKQRSAKYLQEKQYYLKTMCRGATNVTDFIRKVKLDTIMLHPYREAFFEWLRGQGIQSQEEYDNLTEYARSNHVENFLKQNKEIKNKIIDVVAREYHALLRSIMIRQSAHSEGGNFIDANKLVKNVLFFPVPTEVYSKICLLQLGNGAEADYSRANIDSGFLPAVKYNGETMSVAKYISSVKGEWESDKNAYNEMLYEALGKFDKIYRASAYRHYTKNGYVEYYHERFKAVGLDAWDQTAIIPVEETDDKLGYKYRYLQQILDKHAKERVIIFFDYELDEKDSVIDEVVAALKKDKKYSKRLVLSDADSQENVINAFNDRSDAILVVKDAALTEGANLQKCNLIVNYQVTPDPLAMDQRIGRVFRLGQDKNVEIFSFADMNKLEGFALAYFAAIGLMTSNSGDATILAGSNNDQMVTVRCNKCGNVKLMSQQDYEEFKRKNTLICDHGGSVHFKENPALMHETNESKRQNGDVVTVECKTCGKTKQISRKEYYEVLRDNDLICSHSGKYKNEESCVMNEINTREFKCDHCGYMLKRSVTEEGYRCSASNKEHEHGRMSNSGKLNDRNLPCLKICAMSHCGYLKEKSCILLSDRYRGKTEAELYAACDQCFRKSNGCKGEHEVCRIIYDDVGSCRTCRYAECSPRPTVIEFDDKWEAACPVCGESRQGKLRPLLPKTFVAYIRGLWNFQLENNDDESFCKNLGAEAQKVEDIKSVLDRDELGEVK